MYVGVSGRTLQSLPFHVSFLSWYSCVFSAVWAWASSKTIFPFLLKVAFTELTLKLCLSRVMLLLCVKGMFSCPDALGCTVSWNLEPSFPFSFLVWAVGYALGKLMVSFLILLKTKLGRPREGVSWEDCFRNWHSGGKKNISYFSNVYPAGSGVSLYCTLDCSLFDLGVLKKNWSVLGKMKYGVPKSGGIEKPLFSAHTHRFWNLSQQTGTWVRRFKVPGFVLGLPTGWRGRSCSAPLSPLFFPVYGDVSTDALEWGCDLNQAHTRKDMPIYENVFWESIRLASSLMSGSLSSKIKTTSCCACFFFSLCWYKV